MSCSKGTPYYIGLRPGSNDTAGASVLKSTAVLDEIHYQLRSESGMAGAIWGDTATTTSAGNGVGATGTGMIQSHTVYVTVPEVNYTPGEYEDIVTVAVHY